MGKRWSPLKAVVVAELIAFAVLCVIGIASSIANGTFHENPEAAGERIGQAGAPALIAVGVIAYLWQKNKLRADK